MDESVTHPAVAPLAPFDTCTVYTARPGVCRKFPDTTKCGYYEFLKFEREQQGDDTLVALT